MTPVQIAWNYELLKHGRHFRVDKSSKVVVGRNEQDNETLRYHALNGRGPRDGAAVTGRIPRSACALGRTDVV